MQETQETLVWSLDWEDPLEEEIATYSSILAWKISRTEERNRLPSMGSQRVGHEWAAERACMHNTGWSWYCSRSKPRPQEVLCSFARSCSRILPSWWGQAWVNWVNSLEFCEKHVEESWIIQSRPPGSASRHRPVCWPQTHQWAQRR